MKTLGDVLREAGPLDWQHAIYLPFDEVWTESTPCAVLDPNESEDEDPAFARNHGLRYALGVPAVQDIIANAREQRPDLGMPELMKAFLHYYDNDAFIVNL